MTKREIFLLAHQQRRDRGISMSLALRQVYATVRCCGFYIPGKSQTSDIGAWLMAMTKKPTTLANYGIPVS